MKKIIIYFYLADCTTCNMINSHIASGELGDIFCLDLIMFFNQSLATRYEITDAPAFVVLSENEQPKIIADITDFSLENLKNILEV